MAIGQFKILQVACILLLLDSTDQEEWVVAAGSFFLCSRVLVLILYRHDLKLPLNGEQILVYHLTTDVAVGHEDDLIKWEWFSISPTSILEKFIVPTCWKIASLPPFLPQWPYSLCWSQLLPESLTSTSALLDGPWRATSWRLQLSGLQLTVVWLAGLPLPQI